MASTATRTITIVYSGDVVGTQTIAATSNTTSIAKVDILRLASGDNTITVPVVTGFTVVAVTIVPPAGNVNLIKVKGVAGDTGVGIHKTDPTSLALDAGTATFVLNAAAQIDGVRLEWT